MRTTKDAFSRTLKAGDTVYAYIKAWDSLVEGEIITIYQDGFVRLKLEKQEVGAAPPYRLIKREAS